MIKSIIARGAVIGTAALSLMGLGALSSIMVGRQPVDGLMANDSTVALTTFERTRLQLQDTRKELERAHEVLEYSARYAIPADLSAVIYDNAIAEGIAPDIGFRLVQVESNFSNTASSPVSAIGLTQLKLVTARGYDTRLNASDLMTPQVNLQIGFRYLKDLLKQFDNDPGLALEAYNKGPTYIMAQQALGADVKGRYSETVLRKP
jgi:soluble lytic murein transglycosylase-like protein